MIPSIEEVAEFPLVQMVMGEGGYQEEDESLDIRKQLGEAVENPVTLLEDMAEAIPAEQGQYVICGGVRFTIASTVDCFGLIIVQFGNDFEFSLLGLARFRHPRDLSAKLICYIEMQILMSIKPSEGCFKLQALLTDNSWVINKDCKLTGGFALFVWFDGEHKGDFVFSIGGYHPRFRVPEHYPIVPRLGLNWQVNENLSIKGGVYFAFTPACCMLGAKLEATFQSGRISAWFTAYLDAILSWSPLHFEVDIGISLRVEAALFITSIKVTIAATIQIWGPPTGGLAHIDLTVISFDVNFGASREEAKPKPIKSWENFSTTFLNIGNAGATLIDKPVAASPITRPNLTSGRNNLNILPDAQRAKPTPKGNNTIWRVRSDELELSGAATVPVTTLNVGRVKANRPADGIQERGSIGKSLLVKEPVAFTNDGLFTKKFGGDLGIQPMGKKLGSTLNVAIVRDDMSQAVDLKGWTIEEEIGSLPGRSVGCRPAERQWSTRAQREADTGLHNRNQASETANWQTREPQIFQRSIGSRWKKGALSNPVHRSRFHQGHARGMFNQLWLAARQPGARLLTRYRQSVSIYRGNRRKVKFDSENCRPIRWQADIDRIDRVFKINM